MKAYALVLQAKHIQNLTGHERTQEGPRMLALLQDTALRNCERYAPAEATNVLYWVMRCAAALNEKVRGELPQKYMGAVRSHVSKLGVHEVVNLIRAFASALEQVEYLWTSVREEGDASLQEQLAEVLQPALQRLAKRHEHMSFSELSQLVAALSRFESDEVDALMLQVAPAFFARIGSEFDDRIEVSHTISANLAGVVLAYAQARVPASEIVGQMLMEVVRTPERYLYFHLGLACYAACLQRIPTSHPIWDCVVGEIRQAGPLVEMEVQTVVMLCCSVAEHEAAPELLMCAVNRIDHCGWRSVASLCTALPRCRGLAPEQVEQAFAALEGALERVLPDLAAGYVCVALQRMLAVKGEVFGESECFRKTMVALTRKAKRLDPTNMLRLLEAYAQYDCLRQSRSTPALMSAVSREIVRKLHYFLPSQLRRLHVAMMATQESVGYSEWVLPCVEERLEQIKDQEDPPAPTKRDLLSFD